MSLEYAVLVSGFSVGSGRTIVDAYAAMLQERIIVMFINVQPGQRGSNGKLQ
jgi:hypothetical protein